MSQANYLSPNTPAAISRWTDKYFTNTRQTIERNGDVSVTYAVFLRRPCVMAAGLAIEWLHSLNLDLKIHSPFTEGDTVGAGIPLLYIDGNFSKISELETHLLQKIGAPCVAAYNARDMVISLPHIPMIDMGARHCAGTDMAEMMAYAAHVGTLAARKTIPDAKGFIGTSTDGGARFFENKTGLGTMPHALIGYAGSTLKAAQMYHAANPQSDFTVLTDYFGREISDALEVCRAYPDDAAKGLLKFRLDTHGGRYMEELDKPTSYEVIERNAPQALRTYLTDSEQQHLLGEGVSAAAIWHFREELDKAGFPNVKIIASSGFAPLKCRVMALAKAPIDIIGTGSFIPDRWHETYTTADIIAYNGEFRVKEGREWIITHYKSVFDKA